MYEFTTIPRIELTVQWTAFVELLPLWLAPNMVTLLGFFFILVNVALLEIYIPDLVGPVGYSSPRALVLMLNADAKIRWR